MKWVAIFVKQRLLRLRRSLDHDIFAVRDREASVGGGAVPAGDRRTALARHQPPGVDRARHQVNHQPVGLLCFGQAEAHAQRRVEPLEILGEGAERFLVALAVDDEILGIGAQPFGLGRCRQCGQRRREYRYANPVHPAAPPGWHLPTCCQRAAGL
jgi:hypothetical protein